MAPPIPDRWIPYEACGRVIEGTRIICFKVPLRMAVQVGIKKKWDIKALLEKIPTLGAVIDLTNTNRYYDPKELMAAGILHQKILMPGRIIPPEDKVQQFMDTVDEFLAKDCEFLIGVHCTHGLNRTGYMVCRYMRDRLNISGKIAIKRFEKARGYQIERENYVADLLGKVPPPPDLKFKNRHTEVRPVRDKDWDRRPSIEDKDNPASGRREKHTGNWRSDEKKGDGSKEDGKVENWRNEPRSSRNDDNHDTWDDWNKKRNKEESSSLSREKTVSGSSFDFKHDY